MTEEQDVYLTTAKVRKRFGGISAMTIQRWVHDEELGFPQPMVVGRRWYFKLRELEEWETKRRGEGHPI